MSKKKEASLVAHAATNLSFIYFHEGDYAAAVKYADLAMKHNRYNAKALVNKGNCMFMRGDYEHARVADSVRMAGGQKEQVQWLRQHGFGRQVDQCAILQEGGV